MPEGDAPSPEEAIRQISERLTSEGINGRKLLQHETARFRHGAFAAGWEFSVQFADRARRLQLLVPADAPWAFPRVALVDAPRFLTWPHVERNGLLCVRPNSWTVNPLRPGEAALDELSRAADLVERMVSGEGEADFKEEFCSYWDHICDHQLEPIFSIADPAGPSRQVYVWRGQVFTLVGDTREAVERWLNFRFPELAERKRTIEPAGLIWLSSPLVPKDFPDSVSKLKELAARSSVDLHTLLEGVEAKNGGEFVVLLGAQSPSGIGFIGVSVSRNTTKFGKQSIEKGFRPGNVPKAVLANRLLNGRTVARTVERADASWVHGRDQDPRQASLQKSRVVILGCGSVGSRVAELLALAGVGNFRLVDPERLKWANVGRHVLGAEYVGAGKAEALARELGRRLPHIGQLDANTESWQDIMRSSAGSLTHCDLIISAMGEWSAESQLNAWHVAEIPHVPILYGWTEAYCCAGHSLAICQSGGCLQCGFTPDGVPSLQVAQWPAGTTIRREPACGADFQPYGPVELMHVCAMIAEFALDLLIEKPSRSMHRIWSGSERLLASSLGQWTDQWRELANGAPAGSRQMEREWPKALSCPTCGPGGHA